MMEFMWAMIILASVAAAVLSGLVLYRYIYNHKEHKSMYAEAYEKYRLAYSVMKTEYKIIYGSLNEKK